MKTVKEILLFIWQLPQNILALLWTGILCIFKGKPTVKRYKDETYIWFDNWHNGCSLGSYVLIGDLYSESQNVIDHEYGHTRQSRILGPLYLLIIGIPSASGNLYDRIFHKSKQWYYSLPWEKWADKLGGVQRPW